MAIRRQFVSDLYRNVLGREGSDAEIEGHLNNPGGEAGLEAFFRGSPEYTAKHGGEAQWSTNAGGSVVNETGESSSYLPPPIPGYGGNPVSNTPYSISAPLAHDYSAFNTGRQQDPGKSAKDAFLMLSNSAPRAPHGDKRAMAQWFTTYVQPGMNALGHRVSSVTEDGFTYSNHEGTFFVDFGQNSGAAPGSMQQRLQWLATPADDATRQRYANTGSGTGTGSGSGAARTLSGISDLYKQLGLNYGGPGGPGVMQGPVQQVGQDPFSLLLTNGLASLIGNQGATDAGGGLMQTLKSIIDSGGRGPGASSAARFESARELMAKGERTATTDARAALADRGLLSEPGMTQGTELSTIGRIQTRNAEEFARALRDIGIAEDDRAESRLTNALALASNLSSEQARTMLATLGAGTDRQHALAQVALESLGQSMAWNMFLAQFGLERDKVMYDIQNGQIEQLLPLMGLFLQLAQTTTRGYV